MSTAVFDTPTVAVTVTSVFVVTDDVLTGKDADVAPAETVTPPGGAATVELLLLMATAVPPCGACPVNVIVPVELVPPATLIGDKLSDNAVGAVTVKVAVLEPL